MFGKCTYISKGQDEPSTLRVKHIVAYQHVIELNTRWYERGKVERVPPYRSSLGTNGSGA